MSALGLSPPFDRLTTRDIATYKRALLADPCAYCDAPSVLLDHIQSKSARGGDRWENLVGACSLCNGRKSGRSLLSFFGWMVHHRRWDAVIAERTLWANVGRGVA